MLEGVLASNGLWLEVLEEPVNIEMMGAEEPDGVLGDCSFEQVQMVGLGRQVIVRAVEVARLRDCCLVELHCAEKTKNLFSLSVEDEEVDLGLVAAVGYLVGVYVSLEALVSK